MDAENHLSTFLCMFTTVTPIFRSLQKTPTQGKAYGMTLSQPCLCMTPNVLSTLRLCRLCVNLSCQGHFLFSLPTRPWRGEDIFQNYKHTTFRSEKSSSVLQHPQTFHLPCTSLRQVLVVGGFTNEKIAHWAMATPDQ